MNRYLLILSTVLLSVVFLLAGCHWFDDPNELEDCPFGSTYPCPCSTTCEGNNVCVVTDGSRGSYGQCTLPCNGNHQLCNQAADGFGTGVCLADGYCASACYEDADCPAGMGCDDNICVPGQLLDSSVVSRNSTGEDTGETGTDTADSATNTGQTADTGDSDSVDTETADTGSDTVDVISDAQRQAECVATCSSVFTCFPDNQPYTLTEFINACVDADWHGDPCGACRLSCDTNASCTDLAVCFTSCDEQLACDK
jgi:hypothetical protein